MNKDTLKVPSVDKKTAARYIGGALLAIAIGVGGFWFATHPKTAQADEMIADSGIVATQVAPTPKASVDSKTTTCDVIVTDGSTYDKAKALAKEYGCSIRNFFTRNNGDEKQAQPSSTVQPQSSVSSEATSAPSVAEAPVAEKHNDSILGRLGITKQQ